MPRTDTVRADIKGLVRAAPFEPFSLNLENGDRVIVGHPENIAFDPAENGRDRFVVLSADHWYMSSLSAVTGIALADRGEPSR